MERKTLHRSYMRRRQEALQRWAIASSKRILWRMNQERVFARPVGLAETSLLVETGLLTVQTRNSST